MVQDASFHPVSICLSLFMTVLVSNNAYNQVFLHERFMTTGEER